MFLRSESNTYVCCRTYCGTPIQFHLMKSAFGCARILTVMLHAVPLSLLHHQLWAAVLPQWSLGRWFIFDAYCHSLVTFLFDVAFLVCSSFWQHFSSLRARFCTTCTCKSCIAPHFLYFLPRKYIPHYHSMHVSRAVCVSIWCLHFCAPWCHFSATRASLHVLWLLHELFSYSALNTYFLWSVRL